MNLSDVALAAQTAQKESLTLAEKGITSAKVVLTGFVVVFAMLILLIFIIKIYSAIVQKAQSAGSNSKKGKKNKDEKPAEKPAAAPAPVVTASAATDGISDEVVALFQLPWQQCTVHLKKHESRVLKSHLTVVVQLGQKPVYLIIPAHFKAYFKGKDVI